MLRILALFMACLLLGPSVDFGAQVVFYGELSGRVVDQTGTGVPEALVVASGVGVNGWATTDRNGYFHLKDVGKFVSIRKAGWEPQVKRISDRSAALLISLQAARGDSRALPKCPDTPEVKSEFVGGGLKVSSREKKFKGPTFGQHDSHWKLTRNKAVLHVVDGYAWHVGLPQESRLAVSGPIKVRSWEDGNQVGLDLSGSTEGGKRWRWIGAPLAAAVEYFEASEKAAAYFDKIIESACVR